MLVIASASAGEIVLEKDESVLIAVHGCTVSEDAALDVSEMKVTATSLSKN